LFYHQGTKYIYLYTIDSYHGRGPWASLRHGIVAQPRHGMTRCLLGSCQPSPCLMPCLDRHLRMWASLDTTRLAVGHIAARNTSPPHKIPTFSLHMYTHLLEICPRGNHRNGHISLYSRLIKCSLNIHKRQLVLIDNYVNFL